MRKQTASDHPAVQDLPSTELLREAYETVSYRDRLRKSIVSTTNILIVVAALSILVAMLFLPVLRIYGQSMNATLSSGELVISLKGAHFKTGDIVAFEPVLNAVTDVGSWGLNDFTYKIYAADDAERRTDISAYYPRFTVGAEGLGTVRVTPSDRLSEVTTGSGAFDYTGAPHQAADLGDDLDVAVCYDGAYIDAAYNEIQRQYTAPLENGLRVYVNLSSAAAFLQSAVITM